MKKILTLLFVPTLLILINYSCEKENIPPTIQSTTASPQTIKTGETTQLTCVATDADGDQLTYSWISSNGTFPNGSSSHSVTWKAPDETGIHSISIFVRDGQNVVIDTVDLRVLQTAELKGYVYYSGTLIPIPGVTVSIDDDSYTTGDSGHYHLQNVVVGNTEIVATKLDFDTFSKNLTVYENTDTLNIEMTSEIYTHNVSGYISDENGEKLSGVIVTILNPDGSDSKLTATSNATGFYQLQSVPQGSWTITLEKEGYHFYHTDISVSNSDFSNDVILPGLSGVFYDARDGKEYNWVSIGKQIWMSENLAYLPSVHPPDSASYTEPRYYVYGYEGNDVTAAKNSQNYKDYGVLYNWSAAKAACPPGWHLPKKEEWEQLAQYISDQKGPYGKFLGDWKDVGTHLKTTSGWNNSSWPNNGNGTDDFGFTALPGGYRQSSGGFYAIGHYGHWWTSREHDNYKAWQRQLSSGDGLHRGWSSKDKGYSVRYVRD